MCVKAKCRSSGSLNMSECDARPFPGKVHIEGAQGRVQNDWRSNPTVHGVKVFHWWSLRCVRYIEAEYSKYSCHFFCFSFEKFVAPSRFAAISMLNSQCNRGSFMDHSILIVLKMDKTMRNSLQARVPGAVEWGCLVLINQSAFSSRNAGGFFSV